MGEFADMLVDQMRDSDWEEEEEGPFGPRTIRCRYCKKDGFTWVTTEKGWRLGDDAGIHTCKAFRSSKPD